MSDKKQAAKIIDYDIIRSPLITEKSTLGSEQGKITFRVDASASKQQIKGAIERVFGVDVVKVNVLNVKGKVKRFRGTIGKRAGFKKAIVTLKEGQAIDSLAGV